MLKTLLEMLAEVMGFIAGNTFLARILKYMLTENKIGARYDRMIEESKIRRASTLQDYASGGAISGSV